jgi:hydrogenase maturation protease
MAKTIVLGLGNPCLGDDGIGWRILDVLETQFKAETRESLTFEHSSLSGLSLMELMIGYERAIVIDSIVTPGEKLGKIRRLKTEDIPGTHANGVHDGSLIEALYLGRKLGVKLPDEIVFYAVQIERNLEFSAELSPAVEASIGPAVKMVLQEISRS